MTIKTTDSSWVGKNVTYKVKAYFDKYPDFVFSKDAIISFTN